MYLFLFFLLPGFLSNLASTFTAFYNEKFGRKSATVITIVLRDIFGIPLWVTGFAMAIKSSKNLLTYKSLLTDIIGITFIIAGVTLILMALSVIKTKAAAPTAGDKLVSKGIYSYIRHPVHAGTFLEFVGILLIWPSVNVLIATSFGIVWLYFQSMLEEKDLKRRMPEYGTYMKKVPAFWPSRRK
jgi:protein-S-isoprenylcysteine O-methyltransferase Ste14